jgi:hypothetical protein
MRSLRAFPIMSLSSKWLSICLALGLLFAPSLAWSEPPQSSSSVSLSQTEYDKIVAKIQAADQSLKTSSETIAKQEKALRTLWIFSGVLASAIVLQAAADIIQAIKR